MTLYETIDWLKKIALKHPNIGSASEGNIYEYMNANPSVKYGVFFITQGTHSQDEMFNHFEFTLFYVDRLVDDMEENRLQIQSIGKEILSNILTFFCEEFDAECDNITYQPFTQKFVDTTAGIYSTITIDMPKDIICPEEYWKEDWKVPVIVIRNQDKRVTFTENGTYTIDYDPTTYTGLGTVEVDVNIDVDSYYNNGYNQGKTDGISEQKSKLETINITENGTYSKEDGYNEVVVNVPDLNGDYNEGYEQGHTEGYNEGYTKGEGIGYNQGKTDGIDEQKSKLERIEITENGTYTKEDGYNHIEVNVPDLNGSYDEGYAEGERVGYNQGKTDGVNEQKGKLSQITISENGTYSKEDGYSEVVVNVPDLNGSYDEGYAQGKTDGVNEQKSKLETINITQNGTYNREDGYNHIEVNVTDLNGSYDEGYTQGQADAVANAKALEVTKNGQYGDGKTLYKVINVNVTPKVNVQKEGLRFSYSIFKEVPEWADFEGITDMSYMFIECDNLQTIPLIDTSNVTNMNFLFQGCDNLQTIPLIDTSNVINAIDMFQFCHSLQAIPLLNTSNVIDMTGMFSGCSSLKTIPQIDTSNVTDMSSMFYYFTGIKTLISLPKFNCQKVNNMSRYFSNYADGMSALTDVGGWENLKCDWNDKYGLASCPNLTYQSCINILNGLYDFVGNGESTTKTLKVHPNFLTTVGDEISIGVAKGWTITA